MATLLGPWSVQYPINFVANGDTVHQGFYKHIQEITRIYGLLNALDSGKVTTSDLTAALANYVTTTTFNSHVNSASPHPNLTLGVDKITGNWPLSRVSGSLAAGNMDIAGLKTSLKPWIENLVGGGSASGNGYFTLPNGLMFQWGSRNLTIADGNEEIYQLNFHVAFPNECFSVMVTPQIKIKDEQLGVNYMSANCSVALNSFTKTYFRALFQVFETYSLQEVQSFTVRYLAIGN